MLLLIEGDRHRERDREVRPGPSVGSVVGCSVVSWVRLAPACGGARPREADDQDGHESCGNHLRHTHAHTHTHAHEHTHTHTDTQTRTRIHTRTRTHAHAA